MRWYYTTSCAVALAAVGLSACGGGANGSRPSTPAAPGAYATGVPLASVRATIVIPARRTSRSSKRGRAYVSPSTLGLIVTVRDANGTASYGYDVEATAPGCGTTSGGQTTCTFQLSAAVGSDTFDAYTYDRSEGTTNPTALSAGFVASGNLLSEITGYGSAIAANAANVVSLTLEPVAKFVTASPSVLSVSGNGGTTALADIEGLDADSNQISAYSTTTEYFNPITPSIADSGNHSTFGPGSIVTFDGSSSVQPTSATATPYSATLTGTDSLANAGYGGTTSYPTASASIVIAPLFTYASTYSVQSGSSTTLYALAAATPPGATYTIAKTADGTANNCDPFTISTPNPAASLSPPQVAAYAIGASTASPQNASGTPIPCVFAISDGTGTTTNSQPFLAGSTSVIIVVPTGSPTPSASPSASASPVVTPSASPSPTPVVTASPTMVPTPSPTPVPTATPTPAPSPTTTGQTIVTVPSPAPSTTSTT